MDDKSTTPRLKAFVVFPKRCNTKVPRSFRDSGSAAKKFLDQRTRNLQNVPTAKPSSSRVEPATKKDDSSIAKSKDGLFGRLRFHKKALTKCVVPKKVVKVPVDNNQRQRVYTYTRRMTIQSVVKCWLVSFVRSKDIPSEPYSTDYVHLAAYLPVHFCSDIIEQDTDFFLEDEYGRKWAVRFLHQNGGRSFQGLSGGWGTFAKYHKLNVGDEIILNLVDPAATPLIFKVTIVRKGSKPESASDNHAGRVEKRKRAAKNMHNSPSLELDTEQVSESLTVSKIEEAPYDLKSKSLSTKKNRGQNDLPLTLERGPLSTEEYDYQNEGLNSLIALCHDYSDSEEEVPEEGLGNVESGRVIICTNPSRISYPMEEDDAFLQRIEASEDNSSLGRKNSLEQIDVEQRSRRYERERKAEVKNISTTDMNSLILRTSFPEEHKHLEKGLEYRKELRRRKVLT